MSPAQPLPPMPADPEILWAAARLGPGGLIQDEGFADIDTGPEGSASGVERASPAPVGATRRHRSPVSGRSRRAGSTR